MTLEPDAHRVTSSDGTSIGYLCQGSGPGLVLIQGAMADVHAYRDLAHELSWSCTVISAERRGRGLSPHPFSTDHRLARDVEDVDAILAATGATQVFGLSSGAVIALEAARTLQRVNRVAVYEPPFYADGVPLDGVTRLNDDITHGRWGGALLGSLLTAGTAPPAIRALPRPVARALARIVLIIQERAKSVRPGAASTLRQLLPGVRYDFQDIAEVDGRMETFSSITIPVLLLSGTRSPRFLQNAIRALVEKLPAARHVEFDGLGHDGPWNEGDPTRVAAALSDFFVTK